VLAVTGEEAGGAQNLEGLGGTAEIGAGFLDDDAKLGEALGRRGADVSHLARHGRDAEVGREGGAGRQPARASGGLEGLGRCCQRQRVLDVPAGHGIEH
jgi:hypothetical protein